MSSDKIISQAKLKTLAKRWRSQGRHIVFTNGTFDILHRGHVEYLQKAKQCGDLLIVGLNDDRSVRRYKGPKRPLNEQRDRALVLAALECVDRVVLFGETTPLKLILFTRPHVLVKGADWAMRDIVGRDEVLSWGGIVKRIRFIPGRSTTRLLKLLKHID